MPLAPGDLLQGRYRVGQVVALGGAGAVYLAREEPGGAERVIKQLHLHGDEALAAFRGEFALLARLSHPRVVRVLELGTALVRAERIHHYVAERVRGVTLAERARSASSSRELLTPVLDAVEGLEALHELGLRHGDFTPSNVLVGDDGRGTLIDLGCAAPFGSIALLSGTQGFIAPELMARGSGDARADLFSVGQTLRRTFELAQLSPPADVAKQLARLLRESPNDRPGSARELLEAFKRRPSALRTISSPARLIGRENQVLSLDGWLGQLQAGPAPRVFAVTGERGSGLSRLVRELTLRAQLVLPVLSARREPDGVGRVLALAAGASEPARSVRDVLTLAARLNGGTPPSLLVVEDWERLPESERDVLTALARSLTRDAGVALLVSGCTAPVAPHVVHVECGPLDLPQLGQWVRGMPAERRLPQLLRRTGGMPARIAAALRELPAAPAGAVARDGDAAELPALGRAARHALALLLAAGGELEISEPLLDWSSLGELIEAGLAERIGARGRLLPAALDAASAGASSPAERTRAHAALADWLGRPGGGASSAPFAQIFHLAESDQLERAEAQLSVVLEELRPHPRAALEALRSLARRGVDATTLLRVSSLLLQAGDARMALHAAARAARREPAQREAATAGAADALIRLGRPARAGQLLERQLARTAGAPSARLLDRLARTRLAQGDYPGAQRDAERALQLGDTPETVALAHETLGIACTYAGELERARSELAAARAGLSLLGSARDRSRIWSHLALVEFRAGRVEGAIAGYTAALELAEDSDLGDLISTGLLNLGTAEQQAGHFGAALAHYERGIAYARALGRGDTELTLEFNLANLYCEIGAFERAEATLESLAPRLATAGLGQLDWSARMVRIELGLARGELDLAAALLEQAAAGATSQQDRERLELGLRRAELMLARGELEGAQQALGALETALVPEQVGELVLAWELTHGRVQAALGEPAVVARLEAARERAARAGLAALEAALCTTAFEAAERLGLTREALGQRERARRLWDRIALDLPSALGEPFWKHPLRRRLSELSRALPAESGELKGYRRLLALNRRLSSPHSLERVLDYAVQAAVDLTGAERGFLLLADPDDPQAAPDEAVRVVSSTEHFAAEQGPSRSIVARTLERQEPLLSTNALDDPRFAGQGSVHALRLRSVLAVPILSPAGTLGALYVDSATHKARFSSADSELLAAFADQVALAVENARLRQRLERQAEELSRKNLTLESTAHAQAQEVERLRQEVLLQKQNFELRHDYSQIVGRSPAMRRMLSRLDRVVDSDAPVLILGESGTGKELVARAIHLQGPRRAKPFVAINCGALPAALLESELFGHVRGAFTGADRDKLGLMQAASGGTLLLDELGELPPSMQVKLLRAVQEREVQPLGALAPQPIDIRLLCATHRDLEAEVARGKFREDLFYRLAVVTVTLPPLRERLEDLPALAKQFLQQLAASGGHRSKALTPDALRKLAAHPFRGNVRELHNVLTRAFVLSEGTRIRASDIELQTAARTAQTGAPGSASRREFEAQERQRILEALRQSRWNVTAVSASLAIPRATLHRKLKRYGLQRSL